MITAGSQSSKWFVTALRCVATKAVWILGFLGYFLLAGNVVAQTIVRGPYLQKGAPSSIVVRWRTDRNVSTYLEYGPSPTELSQKSATTELGEDHEVVLSSLTPHTRYYYRVVAGSTVLAGGDAAHYFVTSPAGGDEPVTMWVFGDAGSSGSVWFGEDAKQAAVRDAFLRQNPIGSFQLLLMLGDNAYKEGTDRQYQKGVFDAYKPVMRSTVTWPTQGNHDYTANAYYKVFSLPTRGESGGVPSNTEHYYSFDYGDVHFISLNSEIDQANVRASMISWLREDIASHTKGWTVAFLHHPPYSKGHHDSDDASDSQGKLVWVRENIVPILEEAGVDLVLAAHSHSYERSKFIKGLYKNSSEFSDKNVVIPGDGHDDAGRPYIKSGMGKIPQSGTVYVVAGSGGTIVAAPLNHPVMVVSAAKIGSMRVSVDANELRASMIDGDGSTLDHFTIRKDPRIPSGVRNLRATSDTEKCSVEVVWERGADDSNYTIYRSLSSDSRGVKVGDVSAQIASFTDSTRGLSTGEYSYSVRARNKFGSGPWGNPIRVAIAPSDACR